MTFQNFFIGDYTVQIPLSFEVIHQENEEIIVLTPPTYHSTARIYLPRNQTITLHESRIDESKNYGRIHSNNSVKKRRVFFSESES